jgi:hypothetical protein
MGNLYSIQEYSSVPDRCPVRAELALQLDKATEEVYRLRTDSEVAAKSGTENQIVPLEVLQQARQIQRNARRLLGFTLESITVNRDDGGVLTSFKPWP